MLLILVGSHGAGHYYFGSYGVLRTDWVERKNRYLRLEENNCGLRTVALESVFPSGQYDRFHGLVVVGLTGLGFAQ